MDEVSALVFSLRCLFSGICSGWFITQKLTRSEKATPVILQPKDFFRWMGADQITAKKMMNWQEMPELEAEPARLIR